MISVYLMKLCTLGTAAVTMMVMMMAMTGLGWGPEMGKDAFDGVRGIGIEGKINRLNLVRRPLVRRVDRVTTLRILAV